MIIVTNNPMVKDKIETHDIHYVDGNFGDVLDETKKLIVEHRHVLLSHPLSGSIKPNETFYKSILITTTQQDQIDFESLDMIDNALEVYRKFVKDKQTPNWTQQILDDFATIDLDLLESTLQRIRFSPELRFKN